MIIFQSYTLLPYANSKYRFAVNIVQIGLVVKTLELTTDNRNFVETTCLSLDYPKTDTSISICFTIAILTAVLCEKV